MKNIDRQQFLKNMETFLKLCISELNLKKLPRIVWIIDDSLQDKTPTFGKFQHTNKVVYVDIRNRHPIDIMRTLAHELVHYNQWLLGKLDSKSGETGSPEENEAHAVAGVIMRNYNRTYPAVFKSKPISKS